LFGWLLQQLGFSVRFFQARVRRETPSQNDEEEQVLQEEDDTASLGNLEETQKWSSKTHCFMVVRLDSQDYFVDVGFGEPPQGALLYEIGLEQQMCDGSRYKIEKASDVHLLLRQMPRRCKHGRTEERWCPKLKWVPSQEATYQDFGPGLEFVQTAPHSWFRQMTIITLLSSTTKTTLSRLELKVTQLPFGETTEKQLSGREEYFKVLKEVFDVTLENEEALTIE